MKRKVVVTGIGLVTPLGGAPDVFWRHISSGKTAVGILSGDRQKYYVSVGAEVKEKIPDAYRLYNRNVQFALMAAFRALDDAKLNENIYKEEICGTVVSSSKINVHIAERFQSAVREGSFDRCSLDACYPGNAIARECGLNGPVLHIASACATGIHSIIQGMRMIEFGDADIVLAGASEASLSDFIMAGFKKMGVLAQPCSHNETIFKPYDKNRSGFVIGEGAGVVVLESMDHAKKRNAAMYGHITSGVMSNDAHHITSFDCNARQIAHSIRKALHESALGAVDYVNCHGTATEKNDTIETRGIKDGFGCSVNGVSLSSTKPMTGHLLGASGSVELILSLLAMKNNYVPPTINLVDPDPECDLDYTALRGVQKDIASVMSLSYGFGGHIGAIIARKI